MRAGNFYNFRLKLCHTSRTTLTNNFASNYDGNTPVAVIPKGTKYINASAYSWFALDFDTPFNYNGRDNLIVETWWETSQYAYAYCYWSTSSSPRASYSYVKSGTNYNGYPDAGSPYNYVHYMRITITPSGSGVAPTSLGRLKAIYQ